MKLPRLDQKGIAHIAAPLAFIVVFAAVGGYILTKSHAQTSSHSSFLWGHTYIKGIDQAGVHVALTNQNTRAKSSTNSTGTLPSYRFKNIVPKNTYKLLATKKIGCTEYLSNNVSITAQYNNGDGNYHDFYLTNTKKAC